MIDHTATNKEMLSKLADKCETGHHAILFIGSSKEVIQKVQLSLLYELESQKARRDNDADLIRFKGEVIDGYLSMKDKVDGTCIDFLDGDFKTIDEANAYILTQCMLNNKVTTNDDGTMKQDIVNAIVDVNYDGRINQVMYYM